MMSKPRPRRQPAVHSPHRRPSVSSGVPHPAGTWVNPTLAAQPHAVHSQPQAAPAAAVSRRPARKRRPRIRTKPSALPEGRSAASAPPNEPMSLRSAEPSDEEAIVRLTTEQMGPVFQETYGRPLDMSTVLQYVRNSNTRIIVISQRVAGYVSVTTDDGGRANIGALVLDREFQGRGYGTRVMRGIEEESRKAGVNRLEVLIQEKNTRSVEFARRLGFQEVPSIYPRTIVMVKDLLA